MLAAGKDTGMRLCTNVSLKRRVEPLLDTARINVIAEILKLKVRIE